MHRQRLRIRLGLGKTHIQQVLIAAVVNITHALRWLAGHCPTQTRSSAFARLHSGGCLIKFAKLSFRWGPFRRRNAFLCLSKPDCVPLSRIAVILARDFELASARAFFNMDVMGREERKRGAGSDCPAAFSDYLYGSP